MREDPTNCRCGPFPDHDDISVDRYMDAHDPPLWCRRCGAHRPAGSLVWVRPGIHQSAEKEDVVAYLEVLLMEEEKNIANAPDDIARKVMCGFSHGIIDGVRESIVQGKHEGFGARPWRQNDDSGSSAS